MKNQTRFFENLKRLKSFLKELGLEPVSLLVPSILALLASVFEGASFALLAPTVRGLMEANYQFVYSLKGIGSILSAFPAIFAGRSSAIFIFLIILIIRLHEAANCGG